VKDSSEAERIRREMEYLRGELNDEYGAIVRGARVLADWHYYVRTFPWATVGAAAALGFLAVPRRLEVMSPDAATLAKLAKSNRLVVKPKPEAHAQSGIVGSLLTLAANAALRAAIAYAGQKTGKVFGHQAAENPSREVHQHD
jgi:hypothetical protein